MKGGYLAISQLNGNGSSSNNSPFWQKLWKICVPPKIKNFIWRAATNCLPTKEILRRRHVDIDCICPVCLTAPESIFHILTSYPLARKCWALSEMGRFFGDGVSFLGWLEGVLQIHNLVLLEQVLMLCWNL